MELGLEIYELLGGLLVAGIGWALKKLSSYLDSKIESEGIGRALGRLNESVLSCVKAVDQTMKREIKAAKDPSSDGGAKITEAEADKLKTAVWDLLKAEYGGFDGLKKAFSILGVGDGLSSLIDSRIEATVHDNKARRGPTHPTS